MCVRGKKQELKNVHEFTNDSHVINTIRLLSGTCDVDV